jgi:hypothetical protein
MIDSQGNKLEVGDAVYMAYNNVIHVVTIYEVIHNLESFIVMLPNGNVTGANSESLVLKKKYTWPNVQHESHKSVRSSDASTFDFICDDCGATDDVTGGWGGLRKPCRASDPKIEMKPGIGNLCSESVAIDSDGFIIWNGGADRPVSGDTIVAVKVRSGIPRAPIDALSWPQICWRHRDKDDPKNGWDILAYKVIENV